MQDGIFYKKSVGDFYEAGLRNNSIKDAALWLGSTEGNLKHFLYYINEQPYTREEEKRDARLERARAFFDGQNERKKRKMDFDIE